MDPSDQTDHPESEVSRQQTTDGKTMMKKTFSLLMTLALTAALLVSTAGCVFTPKPKLDVHDKAVPLAQLKAPEGYSLSPDPTDYAVLQMEDGAQIIIHLRPDCAPKSVARFQQLAIDHIYDGTLFHRVFPDKLIQGGDPTGTGNGGEGHTIVGEFINNGIPNPLRHLRGTVSMARSGDNDSADSQFFIAVTDSPEFDGDYAAFGRVISGIDEVERISNEKVDQTNRPIKPQVIKAVFFVKPLNGTPSAVLNDEPPPFDSNTTSNTTTSDEDGQTDQDSHPVTSASTSTDSRQTPERGTEALGAEDDYIEEDDDGGAQATVAQAAPEGGAAQGTAAQAAPEGGAVPGGVELTQAAGAPAN